MDTPQLLLIDDDASIRRLCARMLNRMGVDMVEAATGTEGVDKLQQSPDVQAVLLDLILPDGNGAQWAQKLKTLRPGLSIVFFTGGSVPSPDSCPEQLYLSKPFTREGLREVLSRASPALFPKA